MYGRSQRKMVEGWLAETDAKIFELILNQQSNLGINGSVTEIGLHHGKSFILLCNLLQSSEKAYGIDLFDAQTLNLDSSGLGSRRQLLGHLQRFGCDISRIVLDGRLSELVKATEIRLAVGDVRFFSIDGGHWYSTVFSDLNLAKDCLISGGVISLDDYLRPEWPDVARAFHAWYALNSEEFGIIAIGFNKIYLTHTLWAPLYRENLLQNPYLHCYLNKFYAIENVQIPIYAHFFLPEWGMRKRIINLLKMYYPSIYVSYRLSIKGLSRLKNALRTILSKMSHYYRSI